MHIVDVRRQSGGNGAGARLRGSSAQIARVAPLARVARVALIALSALSSGCAGAGFSGGERSTGVWSRLVTRHFDLSTDLPPAQAEAAAEQLERTRDALLSAAWSPALSGKSSERASVVVLGNGLTFEHFFGRYLDGLFASFPRPTFVLWGTPEHWEKRASLRDVSTTSVLRHELVHRLASGVYGRQPRWFAEGLAQFIETVAVSEDGASVVLGRPNLIALQYYAKFRSVTASDAFAWTSNEGMSERDVAGLYGISWLLVHWMYNTQPAAFAAYQTQLAQGVSFETAFHSAFGALSLAEIDKQLFEYARFGNFTENTRPFAASPVEVTKRPMTEADVEAVSAQLALLGVRRQHDPKLEAEGRAHLDRARALEPANVRALRLQAMVTGEPLSAEWAPRLREQVRQRPDDGEAWLLLAELLSGKANAPEREASVRRAIAALPGDARAYVLLASSLGQQGRLEEALGPATKASLLAPWDRAALDMYAAVLFALGRCMDAQRVDRRAMSLLIEDGETPRSTVGFVARQKRYEEGCPPPVPASGAAAAGVKGGAPEKGANAGEAPANAPPK
jgi:tetratricopeptide (TPR) repeat protein